jgi:hypothetical protein
MPRYLAEVFIDMRPSVPTKARMVVPELRPPGSYPAGELVPRPRSHAPLTPVKYMKLWLDGKFSHHKDFAHSSRARLTESTKKRAASGAGRRRGRCYLLLFDSARAAGYD